MARFSRVIQMVKYAVGKNMKKRKILRTGWAKI